MRVDALEESRRVDAKLKAIDTPSTSTKDFVLFTERCRESLSMIQRTLFPLNPAPSSLAGLLDWYKDATSVKEYVRKQLIGGAMVALAYARIHYPKINLRRIGRGLPACGEDSRTEMTVHYDAARGPAENIIWQLEMETENLLSAHQES